MSGRTNPNHIEDYIHDAVAGYLTEGVRRGAVQEDQEVVVSYAAGQGGSTPLLVVVAATSKAVASRYDLNDLTGDLLKSGIADIKALLGDDAGDDPLSSSGQAGTTCEVSIVRLD